MITPTEREYITALAYVPEHLPHYVSAFSRTKPFLIGDFVVHVVGAHFIFIGYPLSGSFDEAQMLEAFTKAKARFKPESVSIIAPALPVALDARTPSSSDVYYRIDLSQLQIPQKTRNMIVRASREVSTGIGSFGREHKKLIDEFLRNHRLDSPTKFIFRHISEYVECDTALIFEARNAQGDLVAFDIAEFAARKYAFYMFNFRSRKYKIPGASDLLLAQIIDHANLEGKTYINLGLGINHGIVFFKKKWGATPFLSYVSGGQESREKESWDEIFDQFSTL